jgi:hypothetical protein
LFILDLRYAAIGIAAASTAFGIIVFFRPAIFDMNMAARPAAPRKLPGKRQKRVRTSQPAMVGGFVDPIFDDLITGSKRR